MEGHHIRPLQQLRQGHLLYSRVGNGVPSADQHPHTECPSDLRHPPPDGTVADDPHCLSRQLSGGQRKISKGAAADPIPRRHRAVIFPHPVEQRQQEGKGVLRHRLGGIARHIAHHDAPGGGGGQVDIVIAGGKDADKPQPRRCCDGGGGDGGLVTQQDLRRGDPLCQFLR